VRGADVRHHPILDEHLAQAFDSTRARLVLDVHGLQFCDSVGLSALIGAQRRADRAGGRMVLRGVHGMLERVLHITGAEVVFTVATIDQVERADRAVTANADRADELA
jgi:anti-sigma B factor antagonist